MWAALGGLAIERFTSEPESSVPEIEPMSLMLGVGLGLAVGLLLARR